MPTYLFECAKHGRKEVARPMADAGEPAYCSKCLREWAQTGPGEEWEDFVAATPPMRRVWSVPSLIVRPWGYSLRPGDRGYWELDRMQEVGHVPTPDANSHLGAGAPSDEELEADEYRGVPIPQPTEDGMQKLHEVARATFSESGSRL